MKKIGVMLAVLIALSFLLTGCGLFNPVKDTVWVRTKTVTLGTTMKYTLSFAKDTFSLKTTGTSAGVTVPIDTSTGTYEYKFGEVIGTFDDDSSSFIGTVEKDTLTIKEPGDNTVLMTFTKLK
ncbi:MAG TPA: hypothetical protein PLU33_10600 [Treponemataceae bacterium]|nr:hypothetical protein [Treponemataceae bacterium]